MEQPARHGREQEPQGSSTTSPMKEPPWVATLRPSLRPPSARPALVCGLGARHDCHQFNLTAQDRGVTPEDGGSCRLPLSCRGKVTREQNDVGGQVQSTTLSRTFLRQLQ